MMDFDFNIFSRPMNEITICHKSYELRLPEYSIGQLKDINLQRRVKVRNIKKMSVT